MTNASFDLEEVNDTDRTLLTRLVILGEIFLTLKSMPRGKSPKLDDLNDESYLFYWDIVRDPLFKVIDYFFQTVCLPKAWGKTFVVLIPK